MAFGSCGGYLSRKLRNVHGGAESEWVGKAALMVSWFLLAVSNTAEDGGGQKEDEL
ncbi:hypothetical protein RJ035_002635 [Blastomyces gilchristii]